MNKTKDMEPENFIQSFDYHDLSCPPRYPFGAKYLLCKQKGTEDFFFIADAFCKKHKDIKEKFKEVLKIGKTTEIVGGGNIYFYDREKGFLLREGSLEFGKADHGKTKEILQKLFPEIPVIIEG